jgi:hypothetical protein
MPFNLSQGIGSNFSKWEKLKGIKTCVTIPNSMHWNTKGMSKLQDGIETNLNFSFFLPFLFSKP